MNRSRWLLLGMVVVAGALAAAFFRPRGPEEFPLAELVPDDAVFYAGFPELRLFEEAAARIPGAWTEETRKKYEEAKPHLSGAIAFYVDSRGESVGLARLTRAAAVVAGSSVEGDAAVFSSSAAAIERRKTRKGALLDLPTFQRLGQPLFLNLEAMGLQGELMDFGPAGFRIEATAPWTLRGRVSYRADRYRTFLERSVQAPRCAGATADATALQCVATDPVLRIWEEFVASLSAEDRDRVEREYQLLQRDLLGGRDVRDFLKGLGPRWGFALAPTPQGPPAFQAWIELPDAATGETLEKMLVRSASDAARQAKMRGQSPFLELERAEPAWRLVFPGAAALRLGEAFTPAFRVDRDRILFSTCAAALGAPPAGTGEAHAELSIRPAAALQLARAAVPYLTDRAFRPEADSMAVARHFREYGPLSLGALSRKIPDPSEREKFLAGRRGDFVADALAELSKTDRYRGERTRLERLIETASARLAGIDRIALTARFTGEGLDVELKALPGK